MSVIEEHCPKCVSFCFLLSRGQNTRDQIFSDIKVLIAV
jgi:hypothetical protein